MPQFFLGRNDPAAVAIEVALLCYLVDMTGATPGMKALYAAGGWYTWQMFIVKQFVQDESINA